MHEPGPDAGFGHCAWLSPPVTKVAPAQSGTHNVVVVVPGANGANVVVVVVDAEVIVYPGGLSPVIGGNSEYGMWGSRKS